MQFIANIYDNTDPEKWDDYTKVKCDRSPWIHYDEWNCREFVDEEYHGDPLPFLLDSQDGEVGEFVDHFVIPSCEKMFGCGKTPSQVNAGETGRMPWSDIPAPKINTLYNPLGASRFAHILLIGDLPELIILQTSFEEEITPTESRDYRSSFRYSERMEGGKTKYFRETLTRVKYLRRIGQYWLDRDIDTDIAEKARYKKYLENKKKNPKLTFESDYVKGSCVSLYADWRYFWLYEQAAPLKLGTVGTGDQLRFFEKETEEGNRIEVAMRAVGVKAYWTGYSVPYKYFASPGKEKGAEDILALKSSDNDGEDTAAITSPERHDVLALINGRFVTGEVDPRLFYTNAFETGAIYGGTIAELIMDGTRFTGFAKVTGNPFGDGTEYAYFKDGVRYHPSYLDSKDNLPVSIGLDVIGTEVPGYCIMAAEGKYFVGYPDRKYCYFQTFVPTSTGDQKAYYSRADCAKCGKRDTCKWYSFDTQKSYELQRKALKAFLDKHKITEVLRATLIPNAFGQSGWSTTPGYYMNTMRYLDSRDPNVNQITNVFDFDVENVGIFGEYDGYKMEGVPGLQFFSQESGSSTGAYYFSTYNTPDAGFSNYSSKSMYEYGTAMIRRLFYLMNTMRRLTKNGSTVYNRGNGIPYSFSDALEKGVLLDHTISELASRSGGKYRFREYAQSVPPGFGVLHISLAKQDYINPDYGHLVGRVVGNLICHESCGQEYDAYGNKISYPIPSRYDGTFPDDATARTYAVNIGFSSSTGFDRIIMADCPTQTGLSDIIDVDELVILSRNVRSGAWDIIGAQ